MWRVKLTIPLVLLAVACGCRSETEKSQTKSSPGAGATEKRFTEVDKVRLMESHYVAAIAAQDLLIRNRLEEFRAKLAELAATELPSNAPAGWAPLHQRMRDAAARAAAESNLAETAAGLERAGAVMAAVVEACGVCHSSLSTGPVYQKPEPATADNPVHATMRKHQWSTERLWEGVTGPLDEAWERGALAVAETELFTAADTSASLREREAAMRALGKEAGAAATLGDRAKFYGRLLASCAGCHDEAKVVLKDR